MQKRNFIVLKKKYVFLINLCMGIIGTSIISIAFVDEIKLPFRSLKILFVVEKFPKIPETTILNQIIDLLKRGHDVYIYATIGKEGMKKVHEDVEKYNLLQRAFYKDVPQDLASYDIIYCQFGQLGKQLVEIKRQQKLNVKIVTCFRGHDASRYIKQNGNNVYNSLFKYGDFFLPVCDYFKKKLIKCGCPEDKIITQHSAIDLSRFIYKDRMLDQRSPVKILSVNRLVEKKGTKYSIEAVAGLLKKYPNIQYTIVGDGPLKKDLRRQIRILGASKNINLIGWATQGELVEIAKKNHFMILASIKAQDGNEEGIPNALKEAMAMGMPVVGTRTSGMCELVDDGQSGFLVEQRDVENLANKIKYLINHPKNWRKMGRIGRKKIEEEFDLNVMNDRLEQIFLSLTEK